MATKAGRLTMSGRSEYQVTSVQRPDGVVRGYRAVCQCGMGNHFLMPATFYDDWNAYLAGTATGVRRIIEGTVSAEKSPYMFATYADAQAAIEAWQRQHEQAQQRQDGE